MIRYLATAVKAFIARLMHQSIPAVPIPPRALVGHFFLIVRPGGRALVYSRAFDSLVISHVTVLSLPFSDKFIGQGR